MCLNVQPYGMTRCLALLVPTNTPMIIAGKESSYTSTHTCLSSLQVWRGELAQEAEQAPPGVQPVIPVEVSFLGGAGTLGPMLAAGPVHFKVECKTQVSGWSPQHRRHHRAEVVGTCSYLGGSCIQLVKNNYGAGW